MMKIEKGQPGYVKARKVKYLIWTIAEFGVVIAIIRAGIHADGNTDEPIYDRGNRRLPSGGQDAGGIDHDGASQKHCAG